MIRARNALRPDAACHSSDVLTPVERAASFRSGRRAGKTSAIKQGLAHPAELVYRDRPMKWGDVPEIRAVLLTLRRLRR
jgi:hypothetical protein